MFKASIFYLLVEVESGAVLPLGSLHADPNLWHLGDPYAVVSGSHHCDGNTTTDIPVCPGLRLPIFWGEAACQAIWHGLHLCYHHANYREDERWKLAPLMEIRFKVLRLLFSFCHINALLWRLMKVRRCVHVHHMHVQNAVCTLIPNFLYLNGILSYHKLSLL